MGAASSESRRSDLLKLTMALGLGKLVVLAAVYSVREVPNYLYLMSTRWDPAWFEAIADHGYKDLQVMVYSPTSHAALYPNAFAFSPFFPAVIHAVSGLVGSTWMSALLIVNVLSFLVPVAVYRTLGLKTALMFELFPTYLVYTTIPYAEALTLLFLTLAVMFALRGRLIASSASMSIAVFGTYTLAWTLPSFALAFWRRLHRRTLLFFALPLLAGALIFYLFQTVAGSYTFYFTVESEHWHMVLGTPWDQVSYLLQRATVEYWPLPGSWVTRNLPFEAFYFVGAFLLLKTGVDNRVFLSVFSLSAILPLLFIQGGPAEAIPRLLLPAFPVFAAYAGKMGRLRLLAYAGVCLALAVWVATAQTLSFFS